MGERRNNCSQINAVDTSVKKWLVVIVAGQSNAVGYDESTPVESEFPENPRICQLGYRGNDNLKIVPLRWCAQNFQDASKDGNGRKGTKGIHYPLGQELLKWIPSDYGVLFIPAAHGGTSICFKGGAASGAGVSYWHLSRVNFDENQMKTTSTALAAYHWQLLSSGENQPLVGIQGTNNMKAIQRRLSYVLKEYPESALLAIVWCQGEHTVKNKQSLMSTDEQCIYGYQRMFQGLVSAAYLSGIKNIVGNNLSYNDLFIYRAPEYWSTTNPNAALYNKIQEHYQKVLPASNYITPPQTDSVTNKYNGAPSGPKNAQGKPTLGPGQTSTEQETHYGNNAFRDYIAPMVADAIKKHYDSLNAKYFTIKNQHELITDYKVG